MKTDISVEVSQPVLTADSVRPSLRDNDKVTYRLENNGDSLDINISTEKLGVLRGCSDSVFRLIMLADKVYSKEV